jgi:hypothetical protein
VIAKIGFVLLANFLGCRFLAVFGVRNIIFDAHLADMQLSVAHLADVESPKREAELGKGSPTLPAD